MKTSIKTSSYSFNQEILLREDGLQFSLLKGESMSKAPFLAATCEIDFSKYPNLNFALEYSLARKRPAGLFAKQLEKRNEVNAFLAINGSNSFEKRHLKSLNLDDLFLNVPIGLLVSHGYVIGAPIFNQASLMISSNSKLSIDTLSMSKGITLSCNSRTVKIPSENRNLSYKQSQLPDFCYYDASYPEDYLPGNGRVVMQLAGNTIAGIHHTAHAVNPSYKPVGLALSVSNQAFPALWDMKDKELEISLDGMEDFLFGIQGNFSWSARQNVIQMDDRLAKLLPIDFSREQAVYLAGFTADGNFKVLSIQHNPPLSRGIELQGLPELLNSLGFVEAISLDAAGGSSLYHGISRVRMSNKDSDEMFNPFSNEDQAGAVSNAIILYQEDFEK